MEADEPAGAGPAEGAAAAPAPSQLPEVELAAYLLVLMFQVDCAQWKQVRGGSSSGGRAWVGACSAGSPPHPHAHALRRLQAFALAEQAVARLRGYNRRTLDVIAARIYSYYSLAAERTGQLPDIRG